MTQPSALLDSRTGAHQGPGLPTRAELEPERAAAIRAMVEDERVHRDIYLNPAVFALERERFFADTWSYLGHASQVPNAGDYVTQEIAGRPLVMVRQPDGGIRALYNRCAHKGTPLVTEASGNTGRYFRCPYHAWTYKLDGAPMGVPLKAGYEGTSLAACESGRGMTALANVAIHRDFVFVKLGDRGPGFDKYFGAALGAIDNGTPEEPISTSTCSSPVSFWALRLATVGSEVSSSRIISTLWPPISPL